VAANNEDPNFPDISGPFKPSYILIYLGFLAIIVFFISLQRLENTSKSFPRSNEEQISFFIPDKSNLTIDDVSTETFQENFSVMVPGDRVDLADGELWLKIELYNSSDYEEEIVLESSTSYLPKMDLYCYEQGGKWKRWAGGQSVAPLDRQVVSRAFAYVLRLKPDQINTYYMHVNTLGQYTPKFIIWDSSYHFFYAKRVEWYWIGLFFGALMALLLYNMYSLIILWRKDTFYYTLFLLSYSFLLIVGQDLYIFFINDLGPALRNSIILILYSITALLLTGFTIEFLELKRVYPRVVKWVLGYVLAICLLSVFVVVMIVIQARYPGDVFLINVRNGFISTYFIFVFSLAFIFPGISAFAFFKGVRQARLYFFSFGIFFLAIIPTILYNIGFREADPTDEFYVNMGAGVQLVLLSIGLADRFRLMRIDKERAQRDALREAQRHQKLQQTYTKQLELEVSERTKTLRESISEIEALNEDLKAISNEKSEILAVASHDLKNPIAGIQGLAEILEEEIGSDKVSKESSLDILDTIGSTAKRMLELIDNLLDLNRLDQGKIHLDLDREDLGKLAERCCNLYTHAAGNKSIVMHYGISSGECWVDIDPVMLAQAIENLISNAIKYSPIGGEVCITVKKQDDKCLFSVRDFGKGIPKEEQNRLFEKFSKLSTRPTNGEHSSGLGLAIVKRIILLHGGDVCYESEEGKGSTFGFTLNCAVQE
jgi:signal transduction histidine kinase